MSVRKLKRRMSTTLQLDASMRVDNNRQMNSLTLEPLEDMVTCPIDLNFLVDPRLLPCGHAFCCDCLTGYMGKLNFAKDEVENFACPICRSPCSLPHDRRGESLQKAFNHTAILDFVRNTQLAGLGAASPPSNQKEIGNGGRKTSIQVSSQMLNLIVQDITTRQRDGKVSIADRAVILDEVSRLVGQLQTTDGRDRGPTKRVSVVQQKQVSTPSTVSPSSSTRNLGRFYEFASRIRSPRQSQQFETQQFRPTKNSYFKMVHQSRTNMKRNATYCVLTEGNDQDLVHSNFEFQPIDALYLGSSSKGMLQRSLLTVDTTQRNLVLRKHLVSSTMARGRDDKAVCNGFDKEMLTCTGPLKLDEAHFIQVQYLRIHGDCIYLTAIIQQVDTGERISPINDTNTKLDIRQSIEEYGVLVKCTIAGLNGAVESQANGISEDNKPFPIESTSCFFKRDEMGVTRRNHPLVFGLDIDRSSGDVYISQPANAMICRLKSENLGQVDGTWYLNDTQLSPYFLCHTRTTTNSVWATCPTEGKIIILDLDTNSLYQFTPSICFGITPSHVVYTTDHRIIVLDKQQCCLYWITKVDQTICFQSMQIKSKNKLQKRFKVIQPAVDLPVTQPTGAKRTLSGGIQCIDESGCLLIYPKKQFNRNNNKVYRVCLG